ncbi:DgyrCDS14013 [Dimorphilus gyrociliatus]|uniref:DgyrCDS14013 n=1 Tax=Dimorphilus gyrociliatus TaxID=2664684 RepID=A0A7I8WCJ5_9ANNE|nr:DgyrCDS14013 [Dimorphilus gyrociliatus]
MSASPIVEIVDRKLKLKNENFQFLFKEYANKKCIFIGGTGTARCGKSLLQNLLSQDLLHFKSHFHKIFGVEPGDTSLTEGITICNEPIKREIEGEDYYIFIVDSQGLFSRDKLNKHDLFILSYLLSFCSILLYNVIKRISENDVNEIRFCTKLGIDENEQFQTSKKLGLLLVAHDRPEDDELEHGKFNNEYKRMEYKRSEDTAVFFQGAFRNVLFSLLPEPDSAVKRKDFSFKQSLDLGLKFFDAIQLLKNDLFNEIVLYKDVAKTGNEMYEYLETTFTTLQEKDHIVNSRTPLERYSYGCLVDFGEQLLYEMQSSFETSIHNLKFEEENWSIIQNEAISYDKKYTLEFKDLLKREENLQDNDKIFLKKKFKKRKQIYFKGELEKIQKQLNEIKEKLLIISQQTIEYEKYCDKKFQDLIENYKKSDHFFLDEQFELSKDKAIEDIRKLSIKLEYMTIEHIDNSLKRFCRNCQEFKRNMNFDNEKIKKVEKLILNRLLFVVYQSNSEFDIQQPIITDDLLDKRIEEVLKMVINEMGENFYLIYKENEGKLKLVKKQIFEKLNDGNKLKDVYNFLKKKLVTNFDRHFELFCLKSNDETTAYYTVDIKYQFTKELLDFTSYYRYIDVDCLLDHRLHFINHFIKTVLHEKSLLKERGKPQETVQGNQVSCCLVWLNSRFRSQSSDISTCEDYVHYDYLLKTNDFSNVYLDEIQLRKEVYFKWKNVRNDNISILDYERESDILKVLNLKRIITNNEKLISLFKDYMQLIPLKLRMNRSIIED